MPQTLINPKMFSSGTLEVGFNSEDHNYGTITTGTVSVDHSNGPTAYYTNAGAHTLAPSSSSGAQDILITNHASTAGVITTSGYEFVSGEFDTTGGNKFLCLSRRINSVDILIITSLQ